MAIRNLLFHATASGLYALSLYCQPVTENSSTYGGSWKYLTYINLWIVFSYFSLAALSDLFGIRPLRKVLNFLLFSLMMPTSLVVSSTFWGLYAIDRELVFPRTFDAIYPPWLNHLSHTVIVIMPLIELKLAIRSTNVPPRLPSVLVLVTFNAIYIGWLYLVNSRIGVWPYGILSELNAMQRAAFFGTVVAISVLLWRIGYVLSDILKSSANQTETVKPKRA